MKLTGLYEQARAAWARAGRLFEVHLDLLYACDLDCVHCYLDDKARSIQPTEFWLEVADQLAAAGVFTVTLSGGEPLLRKDLFAIIERLRSHGIFVHLKTHGGLINDAIIAKLIEHSVSSVQLSYYATNAEIHDAITQKPGSHQATWQAIEALAACEDIIVAVSCSVMQQNVDEVEALVAQCSRIGVAVKLDGHLRATQSGSDEPRDHALTQSALNKLLTQTEPPLTPCDPQRTPSSWSEQKLCVAGHLNLYIDPSGIVSPCVTWPMPLGDLTAGDRIGTLWESNPALERIRTLRNRDRVECSDCSLQTACSFCPGQAWLAGRDETRAARNLCITASARAGRRGGLLANPEGSRTHFNILQHSGLTG